MPIINPTLPNDGEDADAADVSVPIQAILAVLNGAIDDENIADGAILMSKLASAVTSKLIPTGTVAPFAGSSVPSADWLFCAGQEVSRTTYSDLFAIIGTTYGAGDASTTFNLPDLRGRVIAGKDNMGGTSANRLTDQSGGLDGDTLGDSGGAETHTLTVDEIPSHSHSTRVTDSLMSFSAGATTFRSQSSGGVNTGATGGDDPHNNVQPTLILNYIIKV